MARNYIVLILVILATLLLGEFAFRFADWNKTQACATSGARNCGAQRLILTH